MVERYNPSSAFHPFDRTRSSHNQWSPVMIHILAIIDDAQFYEGFSAYPPEKVYSRNQRARSGWAGSWSNAWPRRIPRHFCVVLLAGPFMRPLVLAPRVTSHKVYLLRRAARRVPIHVSLSRSQIL